MRLHIPKSRLAHQAGDSGLAALLAGCRSVLPRPMRTVHPSVTKSLWPAQDVAAAKSPGGEEAHNLVTISMTARSVYKSVVLYIVLPCGQSGTCESRQKSRASPVWASKHSA